MLKGIIQIWAAIRSSPVTREKPLRALARVLWWQVRRRFHSAPMSVPFVNGTRVLVYSKRPASTAVWYYGLPDSEDMIFLHHLLRMGDLFIDGGANVGIWTVLAASTEADVIAVEPVQSTFDLLLEQIAHNRFEKPPITVRAAISSQIGKVCVTTDQDVGNKITGQGGVEVPATTLDALAEARTNCCIKLDLEGHEYEAIRGAMELLRSKRVLAFILETFRHYNWKDPSLIAMEKILNEHGFFAYEYEPTTRSIHLLPDLSLQPEKITNNTIYIRNAEEVQIRIDSSVPLELWGYRW